MPENVNTSITVKKFDELSSGYVLDLVAVFNLMQEEIIKLVSKAERDNWTPEKFINEVGKII